MRSHPYIYAVLALCLCGTSLADDNQGWFEVTKGMIIPGALMVDGATHNPSNEQSKVEIREFNPVIVTVPTVERRQAVEPENLLLESQILKAQKTNNLDMFSGQVKVLGKVNVSRVAIGNGDVIRADVLKSGELLVIAQTAGSTSLRLWHSDESQSDFNIRVSEHDPETRVHMETMVRMRVRMIEFRKSALGKLGIDWSDGTAGPGFAVAGDAIGNNFFRPAVEGFDSALPNTVRPFQTYFGIASNITSRINFLASTGDATTLAEPVLSTTSGGVASFLAGGEVPYPSIGANGQSSIQFKEYGIKLKVSPIIDPLGNVRTSVETEISQLDPAVSVQGAPGLLTRKAQTQVNVQSGETIVISGLLSADSSKDIDKLPGIANLPVIGNFFRAQNARNTVNELVIFVTPEIVQPNARLLTDRQQTLYDASELQIESAHQKIQLFD
ncbi:MAG: type II and III secretion system protein family protein [Granulosicoccus sp.]